MSSVTSRMPYSVREKFSRNFKILTFYPKTQRDQRTTFTTSVLVLQIKMKPK